MGHYAILNNKEVVEVKDALTWATWLQTHRSEKVVQQDTLPNGTFVSTVFLGLNHSFGDGPDLWFETMIFPKESWREEYMERYSTYEQALEGHKRALTIAQS